MGELIPATSDKTVTTWSVGLSERWYWSCGDRDWVPACKEPSEAGEYIYISNIALPLLSTYACLRCITLLHAEDPSTSVSFGQRSCALSGAYSCPHTRLGCSYFILGTGRLLSGPARHVSTGSRASFSLSCSVVRHRNNGCLPFLNLTRCIQPWHQSLRLSSINSSVRRVFGLLSMSSTRRRTEL